MRSQLAFKGSFEAAADGTFTGYGNVFGNVDRQGDRVVRGAFSRDLSARGDRRPLLYQHDPAQPIGWVKLTEDDRGLKVVRGQLILEVARAAETYALMKHGVLDSMSIGYETVADRRAKDGVRELLDLQLWEVSIVTFPANTSARVEAVKGHDADELNALLDSLRATRDAITSDVNRRHVDELRDTLNHLLALKGSIR